jgi:malonate transporter and related proteins
MSGFLHHLDLAAPYFILVLVGYALSRSGRFKKSVSDALASFVFAVAIPSLLFRMMSDPSRLPPFDAKLLIAFFGGCFVTFVVGRIVSKSMFGLDGVGQSIFGLGGIFSNNVLLGIPLAKVILGDAALPPVALVVVFNSLTLWTLVTVSVEWARHGEFSVAGFLRTARNVLTTPVVAAILSGAAFGLTGWHLPGMIDEPLRLMGQAAAPLALVVVGMGLSEYGIRSGFRIGAAMTVLKLLVQPLAVWGLARVLGLPVLETQAVVLLASLAAGVNVYLMSKQFDTLQGPVATCLVLSTAFSAVTTPLAVALAGHVGFGR